MTIKIISALLAFIMLIQTVLCFLVFKISRKQSRSLFIRRGDDAIYLEDEKGKIIEEKIKINIE